MELILCNDKEVSLGNIYKGIVKDKKLGIGAYFVDIGIEHDCFLPASDTLYSKMEIGDDILVQVTKKSRPYKHVQVTMKLSMSGEYLVYLPFSKYAAASKKLQEDERQHWLTFAKTHIREQEGLIIRTAAATAGYEQVEGELQSLRNETTQLLNKSEKVKAPALLYTGMTCIERILNTYSSSGRTVIQTDHMNINQQIKDWMSTNRQKDPPTVHLEKHLQINFKREIELALKKVVWLKDGSYLLIEEGEALTVIDVNTGKSSAQRLTINEQAMIEAMRQIRLRNLSGMIVIDFLRMSSFEEQKTIQKQLEKISKLDNKTVTVFGFTKMGLFELTRKNEGRTLKEMIGKMKLTSEG